jgi:hypothetical protein
VGLVTKIAIEQQHNNKDQPVFVRNIIHSTAGLPCSFQQPIVWVGRYEELKVGIDWKQGVRGVHHKRVVSDIGN